jgi:hypothetical protein
VIAWLLLTCLPVVTKQRIFLLAIVALQQLYTLQYFSCGGTVWHHSSAKCLLYESENFRKENYISAYRTWKSNRSIKPYRCVEEVLHYETLRQSWSLQNRLKHLAPPFVHAPLCSCYQFWLLTYVHNDRIASTSLLHTVASILMAIRWEHTNILSVVSCSWNIP